MVIALPPAIMPPAAPAPTSVVGEASPTPHGWGVYTVREGDTLYDLAARFKTTARTLAVKNSISNARGLWVGARIQVPQAGRPAMPARTTPTTSRPRATGTHVVRSGETLYDLAARYDTTVPALAKANKIRPGAFIYPGQRLAIPGKAARAHARPAAAKATRAPKARAAAYTVRAGDTLFDIAPRLGTTPAALIKANRLRSSVIYPGQRLAVPGAATKQKQRTATGPNTFMGVRYPDKVVANAARNRAILAGHAVPTRTQTKALIAATARRYGVDPRLAQAIALQESGWNQRQVSVANAIGIMQVIPAGGDWASSLIGRKLNLLDPRDNVTAGVVMLRALTRTTGSEQLAIASYYQGLGSVKSRGMYADTKRYVANVTALKSRM